MTSNSLCQSLSGEWRWSGWTYCLQLRFVVHLRKYWKQAPKKIVIKITVIHTGSSFPSRRSRGDCGSLNVIGPHNLKGSGTIRKYGFRYGLVGGSVSLRGWALRFPMLKILPSVSVNFLLPVSRDVTSTMSVCTLSCPHMMIMDLTYETVRVTPIACFLYELPWSCCLFIATKNTS